MGGASPLSLLPNGLDGGRDHGQTVFPVPACPQMEKLPSDLFSFLTSWAEWHPGFPLNIDAKSHKELPRNIQFDSEKGVDFVLNYTKA